MTGACRCSGSAPSSPSTPLARSLPYFTPLPQGRPFKTPRMGGLHVPKGVGDCKAGCEDRCPFRHSHAADRLLVPFPERGLQMKPSRISTCLKAAAIAGSLISLFPMNASAQITTGAPGLSALVPTGPFLVRFDEDGHATIAINGGAATVLTGTLAPDPTIPAGAGQQLALTFMLPEPVVAGDVSFAEVAGAAGSDWLRFTDNAGNLRGATGAGTRMIFYSEFEPGETNASLADRGFPTNLGSGNTLAQLEVGLEGNNGFDYRPGGVPEQQRVHRHQRRDPRTGDLRAHAGRPWGTRPSWSPQETTLSQTSIPAAGRGGIEPRARRKGRRPTPTPAAPASRR